MKKFSSAPFIMVALFLIGSSLTAQNSLKNLVGARGSSVEGEMDRMGYVFIRSDKSTDGINEFWWKNSNEKCVIVRLFDGKVAAVTNTVPGECNQGGHSSNHDNYNRGDYNYNPNYSGDTKLGDLVGWTASKAYNEIGSRGYRHVKDYNNNGKLVKVWYNKKYNQCKKTAEKDGKIDLIDNSKQCN